KTKEKYAQYDREYEAHEKGLKGASTPLYNQVSTVIHRTASVVGVVGIVVITLFFMALMVLLMTPGSEVEVAFAPTGQPLWVAIAFLVSCFWILLTPFYLLHRAAYYKNRTPGFANILGDVWFNIALVIAIGMLIYTDIRLFPQAHATFDALV